MLNKGKSCENKVTQRTLHRCRQTGEQLEAHRSCRQSRSRAWLRFHWKNEQAPPTQSTTVQTRFVKF